MGRRGEKSRAEREGLFIFGVDIGGEIGLGDEVEQKEQNGQRPCGGEELFLRKVKRFFERDLVCCPINGDPCDGY